jgi:hypothetical protein
MGFLYSCKKDIVITSSSAKLSFSGDSVLFDTVFTTAGSTVRAFLVRNTNNQPIIISSIKLGGSYTSPFKINVDGIAGTSFSNIRISAKDSIFVFVTCTLNPNNQNNPIVIEDSLTFLTNGNQQEVYLEAWGQDAFFFKPNVFPAYGPAYSVITCGSVWTSQKPYVIFGYAVVDSGCTLTINPGTKVYMHNNAVLWVYKDATLIVGQGGSNTNPVIFQGDRLEPQYQTVPGQWGEIWLSALSKNNVISWSIIKNGTIGVEADTVNGSNTTLSIDHTIIKSMSSIGLLGEGSYIKGNDLLIEDCQYNCVNLSLGGRYIFNQCTFANYWSYGQRQTPLLDLNNYYIDQNNNLQNRNLDSANFYNCLIWGSLSEEVTLDDKGSGQFLYSFGNCFIKTQRALTTSAYTSCSVTDPSFVNTSEPPSDNYQLNSSSPAIGQGTSMYGTYSPDLDGMSRGYPSTLGAYNN